MQIEIKINGQAAELQEVLRALLNTQTVTPTATEIAPIKAIKGRPQKEVTPTEAAELNKLVQELATKPTATEAPASIEPTPIEPTPAPIEAAPSISFEEFRKAVGAAALINKEAVRAALQKYGAAKTSEVKSEEYAAIMDDLKAIK